MTTSETSTHQPNPATARLKADWEASPKLQAEYPTAGSYVATMKHQAKDAAVATVHAGRPATPSGNASPQTEARWKAEWEASATLQAEYPTAGSYVATMKRQAL